MKSKHFIICTLIAFLVSFLPIQSVHATTTNPPINQSVTVIVELQSAPILARPGAKAQGAKATVASAQTASTLAQLQKEQAAALTKIRTLCQPPAKRQARAKNANPALTPLYHYTHVFNGFSITVPKTAIADIAALPEVREIYPVRQYPFFPFNASNQTTQLQQGHQGIHADALHQQGIRGQGQTIAIIDSELAVQHECFRGEVAHPALTKQTVQRLLHSNALNIDISENINHIYRSSKLPLVYNYANHSPIVASHNTKIIHGTHVSGIACGRNGILPNGQAFNGVAPEAQLVFMSIVGDDQLHLDDNAILAAIDDATKLQVDAINLSFGIPYISTRAPAAKALTTAKNAGIFLSVAAGNAARGDIEDTTVPTTIPPTLIDYHSLGQPANFSACTTVASASQDNKLSTFSSWGGTTDLDLKPEITAPGERIKSAIPSDSYANNSYESRNGTSMATPQITGSAVLLKQYITHHPHQYPNMNDQQLNTFIENLMMSTATILPNDVQSQVPASPRQQGAGLINLEAATSTPAILLGSDGKTKLALKETIDEHNQQIHLSCQAYNFSTQDVTYDHIDVSVLSDALDPKGNIAGMQPLATTTISMPEQIALPAGAHVPIDATITLNRHAINKQSRAFPNGFFIDGFLTLSSSKNDVPAIHIPYSGFYGDWTKAPALDQPNYSGHSQLNGTYLSTTVDTFNTKYALGSNTLFTSLINENTPYTQVSEEAYSALSPNGDGWGDALYVSLKTLRNADIEKIDIKDATGKIIYQTKHPSNLDGKLSTNNTTRLAAEDALQAHPDGNFIVTVTGKLQYPNAHRESIQMKFYTDRQAPALSDWQSHTNGENMQVSFRATDNKALMGVLIDGQRKDTRAYESMVRTTEQLENIRQGDFQINLSQYNPETISITVFDYALNHFRVYGPDATPFMDIHPTDWYYDAVCYTKSHGLMSGIDEKTFAPHHTTNRAQLVTTLWRLAGSPMEAPMPDYTDLAVKAYYTPAVAWASNAHIISGYPDGRFGPDDALTREQMATIFYRFAAHQQQTDTTVDAPILDAFSDTQNIQPWAKEALTWAINEGLMNGIDQTHLAPQGRTTRAQLATVLTHYHQKEVQP